MFVLQGRLTGVTEAQLNLISFQQSVRKGCTRVVDEVADYLFQKVRENVSHTEMSLADLQRAGHPYARRHGKIKPLVEPWYAVFIRSGALRNALFKKLARSGVGHVVASIGVDTDKAPHAAYVIFGTSRMLPRDFITETIRDEAHNVRRLVETAAGTFLGVFRVL